MKVTDEMGRAFVAKYSEFYPGDRWPMLKDAKVMLAAAFAAMPGPAVKVKPLEWEDDGRVSRAKAVIGIYMVRPCLATAYAGQWVLDGVDGQFTLHPSQQAAKAAAQADYEARIMSAITPTTDLASENERLRAAIAAYVDSVNGEPEKDIWDTEDGKPSDGADRVSSDWAWKEYDDKKQAAFDALAAALERT